MSAAAGSSGEADRAVGRFEVFATLAATALLFRWEPGIYAHNPGSNVTITGWLPVVAAFAVLLRPRDLRLLLLLYAGVFVDVFHIAPRVPNHYLLTTCVGLTLVGVTLAERWRDARVSWLDLGERVIGAAAPAMRVAVAVFYLFTGLWKSNHGFLDHDTSCGALSWMRLAHQFPFLPEGPAISDLVIGFTLVLELVGPPLLLFRPVRTPLAAFFVFFHFVLATDFFQNYQNFSWTMAPLLTLYLPDDAFAVASRSIPSLRAGLSAFQRLAFAAHLALVGLAFATPMNVHGVGRYLWSLFLYAPYFLAYVFVTGLTFRLPSRERSPAPAWALLALVILNGVTPLLGVKNRNAWQMYSNVRIEPDASNHLLFPPSLDLFGLEADKVRILETDDPALQRELLDLRLGMTWWDFRAWAAENPTRRATYERGGVVAEIGPQGPRPEPPSALLRKVVWFRPTGPGVETQCQW